MPFIRHRILAAFIICVASAGPSLAQDRPYDPLTMDFPVSPSQAMAAVRAWTGDPQMELVLDCVRYTLGVWWGPVSWRPPLTTYVLQTPDTNQEFEVKADTGDIWHWTNFPKRGAYLSRVRGGADPADKLPAETLEEAGRTFARARYPGFDAKNMQIIPGTVCDGACQWRSQLTDNVWRWEDYCHVWWDDWTGEVYEYVANSVPEAAFNLVPSITSQQAEQYALAFALTQPDVQSAFVLVNYNVALANVDPLGAPRVGWQVCVVDCEVPDGTPERYAREQGDTWEYTIDGPRKCAQNWAAVDIHTGEVYEYVCSEKLGPSQEYADMAKQRAAELAASPARSRPIRYPAPPGPRCQLALDGDFPVESHYPPLLLDGKAYLYVGYLATLRDGEVKWKDAQVVLTLRGREYRLRPGSAEVSCGADSVRLSGVVRNLRGRVYVPVDAFPKLAGLKADYDAKSRTVRLTTGRKRLAPAPATD